MKYSLQILITFVILGFTMLEEELDVKQHIKGLLNGYNQSMVKERLFVHIDNNMVEPGQNIWMKAYVVEQNSNQPSKLSQVLYTDILTYKGNKVLSYKFLLDEGMTSGAISIPDTLKFENYILSAYTMEMKDHEEVFTQVIEIRGYKSLFKKCELVFDKKIYDVGDPIEIDLRTMDINKEVIGKVKYNYRLYNQGVVIAEGAGRTDKLGVAQHKLSLDQNAYIHRPIIQVTTNFDGNESNFYYDIPVVEKKELAVSFYPESESMLAGVKNRIGIRATDMEGIPINFRGKIYDENDELITEVIIQNNGIGSTQFIPEANTDYYLKIPGLTKKFTLPKSNEEGYAVELTKDTMDELVFKVFGSKEVDTLVHAALIGHGKVKYFSRLDLDGAEEVVIPIKDMEMGVAEFCLFDRFGKRLIHRPVFVNNQRRVKFEMNFSAAYEEIGNSVELTIDAKDGYGRPVQGDFSLSITEDFSVFHKTFKQTDIVSSLLLESAVTSRFLNKESFLSGNIFGGDNINDVLLVLNYKRGNWNRPLATSANTAQPDDQEYLQGIVIDKNNVPQGGVDLVAIVKGSWNRSIITSDKFGFFTLPISLLSNEHRGFVIGLADDDNAKNLKIRIKDVDYVPIAVQGLSFPLLMAEQETYNGTEGFQNARILPDLIVEDEIYVQEFLSKKVQNYGSFTSTIKQGENLRQTQDFLGVLRQVTSIAHVDKPARGNIVFRGTPKTAGSTFGGGGYPALFVLDGVPLGHDYHDLDFLRVEHIQSVNVIRSSVAVINYGARAVGGVIAIKTGMSSDIKKQQLLTQKELEQNLLKDVNRAVSVDFFEPEKTFVANSDSTEVAMLKTTLYWNPKMTFDENGQAKVIYKNQDLPAKIAIRINGISEDGLMGYGEKIYFSNF
ncbi:MAG: Plug domain-containing protein [Reichenbachiella sp.]|uniref:TonB-dependent receptor n=1 Tax=Reichenbachiella sp. TaxID=2184521 RepID=UPI0032659EBD